MPWGSKGAALLQQTLRKLLLACGFAVPAAFGGTVTPTEGADVLVVSTVLLKVASVAVLLLAGHP